MLQTLNGCWYLTLSNFSMWKNKGISNVAFNYTPTEKDGLLCLLDEVKYLKNGENKSVVGYDYLDTNNPRKITWQGKGWLRFVKSHWQVEWINKTNTCMVLSFEKTLLTSGGVDIITRDKNPSEMLLNEAREAIAGNEILSKKAKGLFRVLQR